jgi:hypothetical protein
MKQTKRFFLLLIFLVTSIQVYSQKIQPAAIAQGQLDAYNKQDLEGFLSWYADDVEIYHFPNELVYKGKDQMRKTYASGWARNPHQKAEVTSRMTMGNTVIDKEHVTGRANGIAANVIAVYKIENDKIKQVCFVRE